MLLAWTITALKESLLFLFNYCCGLYCPRSAELYASSGLRTVVLVAKGRPARFSLILHGPTRTSVPQPSPAEYLWLFCENNTYFFLFRSPAFVCTLYVADKKILWYLKNEVRVSCAVRGSFCCSLVFWTLFAASGEINYIYKGSTCSFGVASSVFGSSITSGFIRSTLKPWHKPATTSWKPGNSCLLAMRCLSVSSSVVTYIQLITGWKQAWTSKLWLQCFFVCCGFLFFYYFPWNQNTRPFWCRTAWFELWAERAHQACEWSLRCAEARKLLDRFGGDAPPCREAIK